MKKFKSTEQIRNIAIFYKGKQVITYNEFMNMVRGNKNNKHKK